MWRWLRTFLPRREVGPRPLHAVVVPPGVPFREDPGAPPAERTVEPRTLDEICEALRAAGVPFRPRRHGFDVLGTPRGRRMPVRVLDPARVVPGEMGCGSQAPELRLDLACALVPVFGALLVELPFAGALLVDGSRDRGALGDDAAERIQRVGRRMALRAPISFPLLIELARRFRRSRGPS